MLADVRAFGGERFEYAAELLEQRGALARAHVDRRAAVAQRLGDLDEWRERQLRIDAAGLPGRERRVGRSVGDVVDARGVDARGAEERVGHEVSRRAQRV